MLIHRSGRIGSLMLMGKCMSIQENLFKLHKIEFCLKCVGFGRVHK